MEITLTELLDAREERVRIQREIQMAHPYPLICFTMNIAGPVKTSPTIVRAFKYGLSAIESALSDYPVSARRTDLNKTGPTAYISVKGDASAIKAVCVGIEESCALGRLFDIDVIAQGGKKLERITERSCIVCGAKGRACAAGRLHSVGELQNKTESIIWEHFAENDSVHVAALAKESLIFEVMTTPKPGLVDSKNNGSHRDMNVKTFIKSADALFPYFAQCVRIGISTKALPPSETFTALRLSGIEAEKAMLNATNGVNTHKGIIYSMGVLLGAVGRLWTPDRPVAKTELLLGECSALTKEASEKDLAAIDGTTAGGRLYLLTGERGIRGEVADGFPSVKNISLPAYKKALSEGKSKNDGGIIALLHLIAEIYDTSLYNRGGESGVSYAREYAKKVLSGESLTADMLEKMDSDFTEKNLSPGGSADLLAITHFLSELESK